MSPDGRDTTALAALDLVGPALAAAVGDDRWRAPSASLIAGGKSNLTFVLSSPAGEVILRRPPSGDLLPSAHDMGREVRVQRALADTAVPVPRILLTDDGTLTGTPFYVMERVRGLTIRDELPAGYASTPAAKTELADALVDTLADLHAVDAATVGLGDFGRPTGFLARQVRRWTGQWERSRTRDVPEVRRLAGLLAERVEAVGAGARTSIVHGDFRLDNCLMDPGDPATVNAVLDWEMATLGDPMTDIALLLLYWREPGDDVLPMVPALTRDPGFPSRAHLARRYAERAGVPLHDLAVYEAFAYFKFAVIVQGILARTAAGSMAGQQFEEAGAGVAGLAREGLARLGEQE
ncbi:phosphotransferase family protein [Tsukamurella soli]|uniref:Phosphotransferase family protein n=1 Tax=Tsukamurella soli TaxID=644556 RepID=A0ABP8JXU5_9ACTN